MKEQYGQKVIPEIIINNISFEHLVSFKLTVEEDINISCELSILPEGAKELFLENKLIGKYLILHEIVRKVSNGEDEIQKTALIIKHFKFEYVLSPEECPVLYELDFKCFLHG